MKTLQTGSVLSENGREGRVESPDGRLNIDFAAPGETITAEHLFAAAYAACFHSALKSAARRAHRSIEGATVRVDVHLNEISEHDAQLSVEIKASIPGVGESDARSLLNQAHATCPYSKALRGNADVTLSLD